MSSHRALFLLLLGVQGLTGASRAAEPEGFIIADKGQATCTIVARKDDLPLAEELGKWLQEITGAPFAIHADGDPAAGRSIVLATAGEFPQRAADERLADLGPEGLVIRSERDRLWLLATTPLGLQHAVYTLLNALGCRWYFPDPVWTVIPKQPSLSGELHLRTRPAFDYRRIWYGWGAQTPKLRADYQAWLRHNRQLGSFPVDCGHAYERHVPPQLFQDHPDWFALVDGQRKPTQLCATNPEVQQRMAESVLAAFRKLPQTNMVSVEPNDGGGYCRCERCAALGSVSDGVFHLANAVAKAVRRECPDKWVGLLAYAHHSDPPPFRIEPGVYIQVTTGFRYTKLSFDEQVSRFRDRGAKLGVYDYFSVYAWDWDLPGRAKGSRVYEVAETLDRYRHLGLTTYDAESSCNWGPNGLGYWVAAQLMADHVLQSAEGLVEDFCVGAFGKAKSPMRRLYERWAHGERFAPRGLKLALLDLRQAYELEKDPAVRVRLDRVAMYLHWLRLALDYDRLARSHPWGTPKAPPPDPLIAIARELTVYSRRLMDTGMIHAYPMLFAEYFDQRFQTLKNLPGFDGKTTDAWKKERTDIPTADEAAQTFADDLKRLADLPAVEIEGREYSRALVPLAERRPEAVRAWGEVKRSPLFVETGVHFFLGKKGERLRLPYAPFDPGHTVDCRWKLLRPGTTTPLCEGHVKADKGKEATAELTIPEDGCLIFDPGTDYWKAAQIGFDARPLAVWAGRADAPGQPRRPEFRLWLPRADQPLYFFVPKGTPHFVLGFPSVGQTFTTLVLRTADGKAVLEDPRVMAGDELSVTVPPGQDDAVWSLSLSSLRCVVEFYGIPPFLARHPAELLIPADALPGDGR